MKKYYLLMLPLAISAHTYPMEKGIRLDKMLKDPDKEQKIPRIDCKQDENGEYLDSVLTQPLSNDGRSKLVGDVRNALELELQKECKGVLPEKQVTILMRVLKNLRSETDNLLGDIQSMFTQKLRALDKDIEQGFKKVASPRNNKLIGTAAAFISLISLSNLVFTIAIYTM